MAGPRPGVVQVVAASVVAVSVVAVVVQVYSSISRSGSSASVYIYGSGSVW